MSKPQKAYVEDAPDDYTGTITIVDPPPEAPSPPSAAPGFKKMASEPVNVFDFLVGSETPNPSTLNLAAMEQERIRQEDTPVVPSNADLHMVRFQDEAIYEDEEGEEYMVEYGSGPVRASVYETPAAKGDRQTRKKDRDTHTEKKDKKRKRLHVDTSPLPTDRSRPGEADEVMTDAPPVLHSGLTGGLNRLLSRPSIFPPSPDYSGGDANDASPGSPLKRTKHSKRDRTGRGDIISNSIMALISTKKSKKSTEERPRKSHRVKTRRESEARPAQRLLEYKPVNGEDGHNQMVLYQTEARAELFMSCINKGPESEKGCSMNKTLKRYHRERNALGAVGGKGEEEKELWRSLRLRKNDRGEIVVFF